MSTQKPWGSLVTVSDAVRASFFCLLLWTCKASANFFLTPKDCACLFYSRNTGCNELPFWLSCTSLNLWDKLFSAANLTCWEACLGVTQCVHNKKVKRAKFYELLLQPSFEFWPWGWKAASWNTTSWLIPASVVAHGYCAPLIQYWVSSWCPMYLPA